ncbi:MAG: hypothetical protein CL902_02380 [Dehalococcoidia bacterium]|nr:hypothetical protein [Dehalococcoidia bacterium]
MHCRRCQSPRPIPLEKKQQDDNDVFRCQECGYIFSTATHLASSPEPQAIAANCRALGLRTQTTAVQSGYPARD